MEKCVRFGKARGKGKSLGKGIFNRSVGKENSNVLGRLDKILSRIHGDRDRKVNNIDVSRLIFFLIGTSNFCLFVIFNSLLQN